MHLHDPWPPERLNWAWLKSNWLAVLILVVGLAVILFVGTNIAYSDAIHHFPTCLQYHVSCVYRDGF